MHLAPANLLFVVLIISEAPSKVVWRRNRFRCFPFSFRMSRDESFGNTIGGRPVCSCELPYMRPRESSSSFRRPPLSCQQHLGHSSLPPEGPPTWVTTPSPALLPPVPTAALQQAALQPCSRPCSHAAALCGRRVPYNRRIRRHGGHVQGVQLQGTCRAQ